MNERSDVWSMFSVRHFHQQAPSAGLQRPEPLQALQTGLPLGRLSQGEEVTVELQTNYSAGPCEWWSWEKFRMLDWSPDDPLGCLTEPISIVQIQESQSSWLMLRFSARFRSSLAQCGSRSTWIWGSLFSTQLHPTMSRQPTKSKKCHDQAAMRLSASVALQTKQKKNFLPAWHNKCVSDYDKDPIAHMHTKAIKSCAKRQLIYYLYWRWICAALLFLISVLTFI